MSPERKIHLRLPTGGYACGPPVGWSRIRSTGDRAKATCRRCLSAKRPKQITSEKGKPQTRGMNPKRAKGTTL